MSYREFTWSKAKQDFGLQTIEGDRFFPVLPEVQPSSLLQEILKRNIPWAIAVGNQKARSEAIINPILLEVKQILENKISVFSGEEFNVDSEAGLNGACDFLVSQSPEQIAVEAPVLVVVEAKKEDLKQGTIVGAGLGTQFKYPPITEQQNPPFPPIMEQQNPPSPPITEQQNPPSPSITEQQNPPSPPVTEQQNPPLFM